MAVFTQQAFATACGQLAVTSRVCSVSLPPQVRPEVVAQLYEQWVMPLTKEVEVQYLLRRLDGDVAGQQQQRAQQARQHGGSVAR